MYQKYLYSPVDSIVSQVGMGSGRFEYLRGYAFHWWRELDMLPVSWMFISLETQTMATLYCLWKYTENSSDLNFILKTDK